MAITDLEKHPLADDKTQVSVWMGNAEITPLWEIDFLFPYAKHCLCPSCFKGTTFVRRHPTEPWVWNEEFQIGEDRLKAKDETGYRRHIALCKSPFNLGINRIDRSNATRRSAFVAGELSTWSRRDTHWDRPQMGWLHLLPRKKVPRELRPIWFSYYKEENVVAYVYFEGGLPVSYASFVEKTLTETGQAKKIFVLADVYTFPTFRRNGIAEKLVRRGMADLGIEADSVAVTLPLLRASAGLLEKISNGKIYGLRGDATYEAFSRTDIPNHILR